MRHVRWKLYIGGATGTTSFGSTTNNNNAYKLVIETGKYSSIQAFHGSGSGNYYGTIYTTWGNDFDRINGTDTTLKVYNRSSVNCSTSSGAIGKQSSEDPAFIINVKSGTFGYDYYNANSNSSNAAYSGIYVGGYRTSADSSATSDRGDRYILVEGGQIVNINGGLKIASGSNVDTRIYVKGGDIMNIVGGAGLLATYQNRIIQATGGTIEYSVSGGSNGVSATSNTYGVLTRRNACIYRRKRTNR